MPPITIDTQKDKFFISINKRLQHSFIMLGKYEVGAAQPTVVFSRVGKFYSINTSKKPLFGLKVNAFLKDEGVFRTELGHKSISYQAYDIKFKDYMDFIRILDSLPIHPFECYRPIYRNGTEVTLELNKKKYFTPSSEYPHIESNISKFSLFNTCRHSAVLLIEAILKTSLSPFISSHFFSNLKCETALDYGSPSNEIPFYVFPPPPSVYSHLDIVKQRTIVKIYNRMENLLSIKQNSMDTQRKFWKLKELYLQIAGTHKDCSLKELLENIDIWKNQNKPILEVMRKTYIWDFFIERKSATINLLEEIHADIQQASKDIR